MTGDTEFKKMAEPLFSFPLPFFVQLFAFARIYCPCELKSERNDTMKEKEMEICYGDVDDMIFGNEGYVSER